MLWAFCLSLILPTSEALTVSGPRCLAFSDKRSNWAIHLICTCRRIDIRTWHSNIEQHASEGVNKILIGNKCDWDDKRVISEEQARELADELGIDYLETSAKSSIRVDDAFFTLAREIKKRLIDSAEKSPTSPTNSATSGSVNVNQQGTQEKSGCC